eukprot:GGOE01065491.1.p1 GENE.GGOE01065491.1~~GGOE01065491.1.p1  ORF type:complete len:574 (-),score=134.67 GGOE01065491.1:238-1959(-)
MPQVLLLPVECVGVRPFQGWGTSLCWWANVVGRWRDADKVSSLLDLLFGPQGLQLTIARYNLGAGSDDDRHPKFRDGARMPCFKAKDGPLDLWRDEGQWRVLQEAILRGVRSVQAFCNSPPVWMTRNGQAAGAEDGEACNLDPVQVDAFAAFVGEACAELVAAMGDAKLVAVTPFNEPLARWWTPDNSQEGCHFEPIEQCRLLVAVHRTLRHFAPGTALAASEDWSPEKTLQSWSAYDVEAKSCVTHIHTHTYAQTQAVELAHAARKEGKALWMSEMALGDGKRDDGSMEVALMLSAHITRDLNSMKPEAWIYWQAVEDDAHDHNWGLIRAPFRRGGEERYGVTKQYHAMAHFTRFVQPGSYLLPVEGDSVVAAYLPGRGLTIVVTNTTSESVLYSFDLSFFDYTNASVSAVRTSQREDQLHVTGLSLSGGFLDAEVPAKAIMTFLVAKVHASPDRPVWRGLHQLLAAAYWDALRRCTDCVGWDARYNVCKEMALRGFEGGDLDFWHWPVVDDEDHIWKQRYLELRDALHHRLLELRDTYSEAERGQLCQAAWDAHGAVQTIAPHWKPPARRR